MRLDKYFSDLGYSRSEMKKEINHKKVKVNGVIVTDNSFNVTEKDEEEVKRVFDENDQNSKLTLFILKTGYTAEKSREILDKYEGKTRQALKDLGIE